MAPGATASPAAENLCHPAVLCGNPGHLLTKEALLEAVWPETVVSDVVLKVCIRELRHILEH